MEEKVFSALKRIPRSLQGLRTCFCLVRLQSIYLEVQGIENSVIAHQTSPSLEDKTHLLWRSVVLPVRYLRMWKKKTYMYILRDNVFVNLV